MWEVFLNEFPFEMSRIGSQLLFSTEEPPAAMKRWDFAEPPELRSPQLLLFPGWLQVQADFSWVWELSICLKFIKLKHKLLNLWHNTIAWC